jgi:hypothetical protein
MENEISKRDDKACENLYQGLSILEVEDRLVFDCCCSEDVEQLDLD